MSILTKAQLAQRCDQSFVDLTDAHLSSDDLERILSIINTLNHVCFIRFGLLPNDLRSKETLRKIEARLDENAIRFPNDYFHCLLCSHVSEKLNNRSRSADLVFRSKGDISYDSLASLGWKIERVFDEYDGLGYKAILYVNHKTKNYVLAHRIAQQENLLDYFRKGSSSSHRPLSADSYGKLAGNIFIYLEICYDITKQAIEDYARRGEKKYNLSFTGHSLAGWLAQQSVYHCYFDFGYETARAVVFDSPGFGEQMERFQSNLASNKKKYFLDIINYLSEPNFLNTCNKQLKLGGKLYRIFPKEDLIEKYNPLKKFGFYSNAITAFSGTFPSSIIKTFDPATGVPFKYEEVLDWPLLEFQPEKRFKREYEELIVDNLSKNLWGDEFAERAQLISSEGLKDKCRKTMEMINNYPFLGLNVRLAKMATNVLNKIMQNNLNYQTPVVPAFPDVLSEIYETDSTIGEQLKYYESIKNGNREFILRYQDHYRTQAVNLNKQELLHDSIGSADYYLYLLKMENKFEIKDLNLDESLVKELLELRDKYKIGVEKNFYFAYSDQMQIELIKDKLIRLLELNPVLKKLLLPFSSNQYQSKTSKEQISGEALANSLRVALSKSIDSNPNNDYEAFKEDILKLLGNKEENFFKIIKLIRFFNGLCKQKQEETNRDLEMARSLYLNGKEIYKNYIKCELDGKLECKLDDVQHLIEFIENLKSLCEKCTYNLQELFEFENKIFELANKSSQSKVAQNRVVIGKCLLNMGRIYLKMGKHEEALKCFNKSYEAAARNENLSTESVDLSDSLHSIGSAYAAMKSHKMALEYYEKSLEIRRNTLPEEHPAVAASLLSIGSVYFNMGKHKDALGYINASYEIRRKLCGKADLDKADLSLAESLNWLGHQHSATGKYQAAIERYMESLKIRESMLPQEHPDLASSMLCVGFAYFKMAKYDKALEFFIKSYDIRKKIFHKDHQDVAESLHWIGASYAALRKHELAMNYLLKAFEMRRKAHLTDDHLDIASSLVNIGFVCSDMGKHDEALKCFSQSYEIRIKLLTKEHVDIAESLHWLGNAHASMKNYKTALDYLGKAHEMRKKILDENHSDVAASLLCIGFVYYKMAKYDEALKSLIKVYEMRVLPEEHDDFAKLLSCIGNIYVNIGKKDKALVFYNKSYESMRKTMPDDHPELVACLNNVNNLKASLIKPLGVSIPNKPNRLKKLIYIFK
jgi:tetratricopeptide (TPR) repeat protein